MCQQYANECELQIQITFVTRNIKKSDLGATWSKGSWYSKNNTFLTTKQFGKIHFVSWRSFIQRYCRQLVTDLYIIITSITLHYTGAILSTGLMYNMCVNMLCNSEHDTKFHGRRNCAKYQQMTVK